MIVRNTPEGYIIKIQTELSDAEFLKLNPTGGFFSVDSLPPSSCQKWIFSNSEIISDPILDKEIADNMYKAARRAEYPDFIEYIDGIVKGDQQQIDNYIQKCRTIKEKYPKPI